MGPVCGRSDPQQAGLPIRSFHRMPHKDARPALMRLIQRSAGDYRAAFREGGEDIGTNTIVSDDSVLRNDADARNELQGAVFKPDNTWLEQSIWRSALHIVPYAACRPQRVVHAVDDRGVALGKHRNADVDAFLVHGANGSNGSEATILPLPRDVQQ
jgi:hypothetical protein